MKQTLDLQMAGRYSECIRSHPDSPILIRANDFPDVAKEPMFNRVLKGELTHIMVKRGPMLIVTWTPSHNVQALFDSYGS